MKYFSFLVPLILTGCISSEYDVEFMSASCIKPHDGYYYSTCFPIHVNINNLNITIPANFTTDLASIPRWYWAILSPAYSGFMAPAILHDYLYNNNLGFSRKQIDKIFYSALRKEKVSSYTASKMYLAVRIFGSVNFKQT